MNKGRIIAMLTVLAVVLGAAAQEQERKLSAEAGRLLELLRYIEGEKTLSGTIANVNWNLNEAQWVNQHTGKWPALNFFDFIHHVYSQKGGWIDYTNTTDVVNWHRAGGLVGCMWHWNVPTNDGQSYTCTPGTEPGQTSFDVRKIFEPESDEYKLMMKDINTIASYLKPFKTRKIPILWRPLHEAGGMWFWWGRDAEACNELWRVMYRRFQELGLDNLIWVWTSAAAWNKPYSDGYRWYPGDEYVDIVSIDVYNNSSAANVYSTCYRFLQKQSPSKLVALTECGNVPEVSAMWRARAKWLFFMPWYDYDRTNDPGSDAFKSEDHSSCNATWWRDAFEQDYVLSRDDFKQLQQDFVGIQEVNNEEMNDEKWAGAAYDLGGRRIGNPRSARGIVIRGGRKCIVK